MSKKRKQQLFKILIKKGLATSESEAKALVLSGNVIVDDQRCDKAGALCSEDASVRIRNQKQYVSRGGEKLSKALSELKVPEDFFKDRVVLDVGASTGGFTDLALQKGAKKVIALDVGFNQLHNSLLCDPRIISLEKTNITDFDAKLYPRVEIVLADLSFTSLSRLAEALLRVSSPPFFLLLLIKPQFELDKEEVPPGGVVNNSKLELEAVERVKKRFNDLGINELQVIPSPVKGRKGNQEYFFFAHFEA